MQVSFLLLLGVAGIQAFHWSNISDIAKRTAENAGFGRRQNCPAVWSTISKDLTGSFVSSGQCSDLARAAIRYAFHDAGTFSQKLPTVPPASGGADGSLLLSGGEIGRRENAGLRDYHSFITGKYNQYKSQGVGAADLIQFAGNHAIVSCPGGPTVQTLIGRTDTSNAAPEGLLPPAFGPGSDHNSLFQVFMDKGFSAVDLAALIGAHSTSRAFATPQVPVGASQDSMPGIWDIKYYSETYNPPPGVRRFDSDINLSNPNTTVGKQFQSFVNNKGKWNGNFASAMFRLGLLGISPNTYSTFTDCTGSLPRTTGKRNVMAAPINFRFR
jgi:manganese peroxidase